MRGGVCYVSKRYGKANNKYLRSYDSKKPMNYIIHLDKNNWYGYAIWKSLYEKLQRADLTGWILRNLT